VTTNAANPAISVLRRYPADVAIVLLLLIGAWGLGWSASQAYRSSGSIAHQPAFDLQFYSVALMTACGRGSLVIVTGDRDVLVVPSRERQEPRAVADFLDGRRRRLDCDHIGATAGFPPTLLLRSSSYLIGMIAATWRLTGPNWAAIDALMGGLFALTVLVSYFIGRLAMGPAASAILAALFGLSPLHLSGLANIRDYSKAPFFAVALLICAALARRRWTRAQTLALSAAAGAALGAGFGMRTDMGVYLPLVVATLLVFLPGALVRTWRIRLLGAAVCVGLFVFTAWPIIQAHAGGNTGHWAILGFSHEFDSALGLRAAPYRLHYFYSDSAVETVVNAFRHRVDPSAGAAAPNAASYEAFSGMYVSALLTTFPADMLVRIWAAVIKVSNLPFADAASEASVSGLPMPLLPAFIVRTLGAVSGILRRFDGAGIVLIIAAIAGIAAFDVRLAAFVCVAFCSLSGYAAIQFQPRHVFHLALLPLWALTFVIAHLIAGLRAVLNAPGIMRSNVSSRLVAITVCLILMACVVAVPLAAARGYQRQTVERLLSAYQDAPRDVVPLDPQAIHDGWTRLGASALAASADRPVGPTRADMVVLQVSAHCGPGPLEVRFTYAARPSTDFSRTIDVRPPGDQNAPVEVFMPVYYTGVDLSDPQAYRFAGVDVPSPRTSCVQGIYRLRDSSRHRLLLEAVLPAQWRQLSLYQSIEAVERAHVYAGGSSPLEMSDR
jgi:hypothetical protein